MRNASLNSTAAARSIPYPPGLNVYASFDITS